MPLIPSTILTFKCLDGVSSYFFVCQVLKPCLHSSYMLMACLHYCQDSTASLFDTLRATSKDSVFPSDRIILRDSLLAARERCPAQARQFLSVRESGMMIERQNVKRNGLDRINLCSRPHDLAIGGSPYSTLNLSLLIQSHSAMRQHWTSRMKLYIKCTPDDLVAVNLYYQLFLRIDKLVCRIGDLAVLLQDSSLTCQSNISDLLSKGNDHWKLVFCVMRGCFRLIAQYYSDGQL